MKHRARDRQLLCVLSPATAHTAHAPVSSCSLPVPGGSWELSSTGTGGIQGGKEHQDQGE